MNDPLLRPVRFEQLEPSRKSPVSPPNNLAMLGDVTVQVSVQLGKAKMLIKDLLELCKGSLVELDKLSGEPVDILVNGKLFAKGEVMTIDESFGVRVVEILPSANHIF